MKGVAPYQGSGGISTRWRHMKGWRYINEVAPYEGMGPYQGSGAISRASCPDETRPVLQTAVPLTSPPTSSRQSHHQSRCTPFGEHSVLQVRS